MSPGGKPRNDVLEAQAEGGSTFHPRLLAATALAGWLPPFVGNRLRTMALRAAGIRIGAETHFFGYPIFVGSGPIEQRLVVGHFCGFNKGVFFDLSANVDIGHYVAVGHDVMFLTSTYERGESSRRAGARRCAPIVVHDGAWLGARATILPGVTIGAGSVISAGIAVSEDVPENMLITGTQRVSLARWRP